MFIFLSILLVPDPPKNVIGSAQGSTVYLRWNNPDNGRADKFLVEWSANDNSAGTNETDYVDDRSHQYSIERPNSDPGQKYKAVIRSVSGTPNIFSTSVERFATLGL